MHYINSRKADYLPEINKVRQKRVNILINILSGSFPGRKKQSLDNKSDPI